MVSGLYRGLYGATELTAPSRGLHDSNKTAWLDLPDDAVSCYGDTERWF